MYFKVLITAETNQNDCQQQGLAAEEGMQAFGAFRRPLLPPDNCNKKS